MTIEQQAQRLQDSVKQLERTNRQRWTSPDEQSAVRATLKARLAEAERTLRLPDTLDTAHSEYP